MSSSSKIVTSNDILTLIRTIRRAPGQEGDYAPHKPLMLLVALARIQNGAPRMAMFREIEPLLKNLLHEFAKTGAENTRHLPYWRLKNDHDGRLWELHDPDAVVALNAVSPPSLKDLRSSEVTAGFAPEIFRYLHSHPDVIVQAAQEILAENFPPTLHDDIAQAVGLRLETIARNVRDDEADGFEDNESQSRRRRRNPGFRDEVLRAYEYRCSVCGFDMRIGHVPAGLEAAHIKWHNVGGPDEVQNGLALCALHHKLFDLGAFTIKPDDYRIVYSKHAIAGDRGMQGELRHHGRKLLPPQEQKMLPGEIFLAWNVKNVFKAPERSWST